MLPLKNMDELNQPVDIILRFFNEDTEQIEDYSVSVPLVVAQYIESIQEQNMRLTEDCDALEELLDKSELLLGVYKHLN